MKKIVLSLAGALAATAFAPEAAAVPAFARQTGMACHACHSQHVPVLNSFGRSFKAAGFTMMGAQGKVEGDSLSIPDTLNASMLVKLRYQKDNTAGTANTKVAVPTRGEGRFDFPDEFVLLFGGRVAGNIGFLTEVAMGSANTATAAANFKMPFAFDVGGAKLSIVPFWSLDASPAYGYELSSGGVMKANRWSEHAAETSAVQYNSRQGVDGGAAHGFSLVAQNDMGFINVTRFSAGGAAAEKNGALDSNYYRLAVTPTVGNWAIVGGIGGMSGSSFNGVAEQETRSTFVDFQAQGQAAGKDLGVYAQYSRAPHGSGAIVNSYSGTAASTAPQRRAFTLGADYSVIPHALSVGAAYRSARNGAASGVNGDNAWTVQAVYNLYQNVDLHAVYSKMTGSAHTAATVNNLTTLMLEAAW